MCDHEGLGDRSCRTRVFLLGGTSDSRAIAAALEAAGVEVLVSTLTAYGARLVASADARHGALDADGIADAARGCAAIADATHPFASAVSAEGSAAARALGLPYLRFERPSGDIEGALTCRDHEEAARAAAEAAGAGGAVLLTVGSRHVAPYAAACKAANVRCVARVLPAPEALAACEAAGLSPVDVIAMQGPTTAALDEALLRHLGARVLVTKDSGDVGGVGEKAEACRRLGATLVVVARPGQRADAATRTETVDEFVSRVLGVVGADSAEPSLAPVLMVQGTTSNAGKSVMAAALCRIFARRGLSVAPFKSQNMALNSAVTPEGAEIGRAQAYQAAAAGLDPHADMNPVLLKPCSQTGSQVIVLGAPVGTMAVREYHAYQPQVWPVAAAALDRLRARHDVIVAEGAGSPAEVNLRHRDIANMRVAKYAQAPVLLVVDIDRGGAFAHLVGTMELLLPEERALVAGFVINRFRGDATLLDPGIAEIERRTGIPVLGVVPMLADWRGEEEDSLGLEQPQRRDDAALTIAAVRLPYLSNYTDLDALTSEPDVRVTWVRGVEELAGADAIVLPGTKSTLHDLAWLRSVGLAESIVAAASAGVPVVGICGGYQMLGRTIADPDGVEAVEPEAAGLGLLDVSTVFVGTKRTVRATGRLTGATMAEEGTALHGYEIHMGRSTLGPDARPFAMLETDEGSVADGAVCAAGTVCGTYLHGLFDSPELRRAWLDGLRVRKGLETLRAPAAEDDGGIDRLADHVEAHLDIERIVAMLGLEAPR